MPKIILFHGTAHDFDSFDNRFIMRGTEPNSSLGIHLTEDPSTAVEYAEKASRDTHGNSPRVLMVEVEVCRVGVIADPADYLGRDPEIDDLEHTRSREEFIERRFELEDEGFDGLCMDENPRDDLKGAWIIFDAKNIKIVRSMSLEEAQAFADEFEPEVDLGIEFQSVRLFEDQYDDEDHLSLK